ncbi:translation initiation factor eIF-2B subunit delta [Strigomonas culicis]|uniref:Translation initiation factor eIF2B subunit delta n=1 Tax=Strigomonas culicis TaxID=28005 RepID=S9U7T9_9TRYP|nr:translation initiation factor eIF-2B subunit delta [Strigomonas culicis]EPY28958.1 translation initiation factor eIF-2B subunit delta [Strigomonas culicis]|eukprot:EPY24884.1 translation initiation factor eIF-2B subunit delta [Strigomonas culicis]
MQLKGQQSSEAVIAVNQQRDLKKQKDRIRKLQKRVQDPGLEEAVRDQCLRELEEAKAFVERVESLLPPAAPTNAVSRKQEANPPASKAKNKGAVKTGGGTVPPSPAHAPTSAPTTETPKEELPEPTCAADQAKLRAMLRNAMEDSENTSPPTPPRLSPAIHPRVAEAALLMDKMVIVGGNAHTMAIISAFRELIESTTSLTRASITDINTDSFVEVVEENFKFICRQREPTAGMKYVKETLLRRLVALRDAAAGRKGMPSHVDQVDSRGVARGILDSIESEITLSTSSIVEDRSMPYVSSSDTILVFGRSSVVENILLSRARLPPKKPKRVIVLDSAPLYEGRELAHKLSEEGICVTYGLLTSCCTLMSKCTRVLIGASSVLQNGDVVARCGTAIVATCAKSFRKPVLCVCESYKFVAEVWVGNVEQNTTLLHVGSGPEKDAGPTLSGTVGAAANLRSPKSVGGVCTPTTPRNTSATCNGVKDTSARRFMTQSASGAFFDVTPAAYVDMFICEMGCLHTSAIVAAIKEREGRDEYPVKL